MIRTNTLKNRLGQAETVALEDKPSSTNELQPETALVMEGDRADDGVGWTADPIAGIDMPILSEYFATLNAGDFDATSQLFAADGALHPPFEPLVVGPTAIAAYLKREAIALVLRPRQGTMKPLEDGCTQYDVVGQVQTPWFTVNVAWLFILSPQQQIFVAKVKLLASLQELLHLRQVSEQPTP